MKDLGRIRRLFYRDGLSLSEISRKTGYSRNTVKRWLRTPEGTEPKYERQNPNIKIAPYAARLIKALEADARRPKRDRRTALKLFGELQAAGFTGTYCRVTEFIRRWRADGGAAVSKAFVPLHFELGEAFQFDWSEERLIVGGVWRKILAAHLKLCHSRAFILQAYPTQSHEMLFDAHTRAFAALGGIPRRGIYDNMKTAVDKVKRGKGRINKLHVAVMLDDAVAPKAAKAWSEAELARVEKLLRVGLGVDAGRGDHHDAEHEDEADEGTHVHFPAGDHHHGDGRGVFPARAPWHPLPRRGRAGRAHVARVCAPAAVRRSCAAAPAV